MNKIENPRLAESQATLARAKEMLEGCAADIERQSRVLTEIREKRTAMIDRASACKVKRQEAQNALTDALMAGKEPGSLAAKVANLTAEIDSCEAAINRYDAQILVEERSLAGVQSKAGLLEKSERIAEFETLALQWGDIVIDALPMLDRMMEIAAVGGTGLNQGWGWVIHRTSPQIGNVIIDQTYIAERLKARRAQA